MSTEETQEAVREPAEGTLDWILRTRAQEAYSGKPPKGQRPRIVPPIQCADGATISVQASSTHYCLPRDDYGYWGFVEVGFPSIEPPESWAQYFDGNWESDDRTKSVYGYVPVELVREYIASHGGERVANPAAFAESEGE